MAKPILVIKVKHNLKPERITQLAEQARKGLDYEYHILCVQDPYIETEISFEVHGSAVYYSMDEIKNTIDANTPEE